MTKEPWKHDPRVSHLAETYPVTMIYGVTGYVRGGRHLPWRRADLGQHARPCQGKAYGQVAFTGLALLMAGAGSS